MAKFKKGDKGWLTSPTGLKRVEIIRIDANAAVVRLETGGGIRVSVSRLIADEDIPKKEEKKGYRSPYNYWH